MANITFQKTGAGYGTLNGYGVKNPCPYSGVQVLGGSFGYILREEYPVWTDDYNKIQRGWSAFKAAATKDVANVIALNDPIEMQDAKAKLTDKFSAWLQAWNNRLPDQINANKSVVTRYLNSIVIGPLTKAINKRNAELKELSAELDVAIARETEFYNLFDNIDATMTANSWDLARAEAQLDKLYTDLRRARQGYPTDIKNNQPYIQAQGKADAAKIRANNRLLVKKSEVAAQAAISKGEDPEIAKKQAAVKTAVSETARSGSAAQSAIDYKSVTKTQVADAVKRFREYTTRLRNLLTLENPDEIEKQANNIFDQASAYETTLARGAKLSGDYTRAKGDMRTAAMELDRRVKELRGQPTGGGGGLLLLAAAGAGALFLMAGA